MRGLAWAHTGDDPLWRGVCHKTGGGSNSNASNDTKDQRNAIGGSGILAGQGGTVNFSIDNPEGFTELLKTSAGFFEGALEFASNQSALSAAAYGKALDAVQTSKQSEEQNFGLQALKLAGPIILIVGLGLALMKAK